MADKDIIKLKEYLSGKIDIPECKINIDCYVLDNGKRVLTQRGIQKALGIPSASGGNTLKNLMLSYKTYKDKPKNYKVIESGFNNVCSFQRKGAGGSQLDSKAYDAVFLMDICHFIQDLDKYNLLPFEWKFLNKNATIIERAFSKLGIYAYIDEATGYLKEKRKEEYRELFNKFLLEEAGEYSKCFPDEFFDEVYWKLWLQRSNRPQKAKTSGLCGKIINKYIYYPLGINELHLSPEEAGGIFLKNLQNKNPVGKNGHRQYKHHQFLNDIGKEMLKKQITIIITLAKISSNKTKFQEHFARLFNFEKTLFNDNND